MRSRRSIIASETFIFTVNLAARGSNLRNSHIETLSDVTRLILQRHLFEIIAMVVLPDHLLAIWRLPEAQGVYQGGVFAAMAKSRCEPGDPIDQARARHRAPAATRKSSTISPDIYRQTAQPVDISPIYLS